MVAFKQTLVVTYTSYSIATYVALQNNEPYA